MTISVLITTYGDPVWEELAWARAYPSALDQGADEIIVRHHPNLEIAAARNATAREATGEWLLHLDADDELSGNYVWSMRKAISEAGDTPTLFTPAVQHIRKGRPGQPAFMDRGISLRDDNWLVVGTVLRHDLFWQVGGFEEYPHGFEDWALWSKCYRVGAEIVKVPGAVYLYHHNPQSKHKQGWRNRKQQVATHQRVAAELDAWEKAL